MNNNQGRRRTRRARNQRKQKTTQISRILLMICMMALVAVVSIGGTLAWLTDKTEEISNTFTISDVEISLTETAGVENNEWEKQLIPGKTYPKNPIVSVVDNGTSVDVYLFVKFDDQNKTFTYTDAEGNTKTENYLVFTSTLTEANGWKLVNGETDVYWRVVGNNDETQSWNLIAENAVKVHENLTKELTDEDDEMPSLSYTAYAIQTEGFEPTEDTDEAKAAAAAAAWAKTPKN